DLVNALDATVEQIQAWIDYNLHGAVAATHEVLPGMLERGSGTLLYTTGASSREPAPRMGTVGPAGAALRNWVLALHPLLAPKGAFAAHVPIGVRIGQGGPETDPDTIAEVYWDLHIKRDRAEEPYGALPADLLRVD